MNTSFETITLVTVCNNHYAIMLAALIKSIEINHQSSEPIDLYIVDDGITGDNKNKIIQSMEKDSISMHWLKMKETLPRDISLPLDLSTFPLNVYVRLFIPYFLPNSCAKAIYLDVDMIVRKDISVLWNTDIGTHLIAGVVDRSERFSSTWGGVKNFRELHIDGESKYFNSGLLVINLAKWRSTTLSRQIVECIHINRKYANFPDQYGLNVVLANQWFELDRRWNTYAPSDEKDPYIIHFIGRKPIYANYENNLWYKEEFIHYLTLTLWNDFKQLHEYERLFHKLYHKLKKVVFRLIK